MTLTLPREAARKFRAVARKCQPARQKGPDPPALVTAHAGTLTLYAQFGDAAIALEVPEVPGAACSVLVPMDGLDRLIDASDDPIELECGRGRSAQPDEVDPVVPELPDDWADLPAEFLVALHEAGRTTAREAGKYAVTRVQLQGKTGRVLGTDGKQALLLGGFAFPFMGDLLVTAIPVFGAKELQSESKVSMGRTATHLVVRAGPWTVWLSIDVQARFPDVSGAIPRTRLATILELTEADADTLIAALRRLPGADVTNGPVLLDLGTRVVVLAQGEHDPLPTEVILRESTVTGPPVAVGLNRTHLARALRLGFRQLRFAGADRPWVAEEESRVYLSASLDAASVLRSDPVASSKSLPSRFQSTIPETPMPVQPTTNGHAPADPDPGDPDPLAEAEGLRVALADAQARAGRLVASLRGYRKQHKTVASALASLRALRLD